MKRNLMLLLSLLLLPVCFAYAQGEFWGISTGGGVDGIGVIFKTSSDGSGYTVQTEFSTTQAGGRSYGTLTLAGNGKFYGLTSEGGRNDFGVLFEYDPVTEIYSRKVDFDGAIGGWPGKAILALSDDGKLYGTTSRGGAFDNGVLFEYDPAADTYINKHDFQIGGNYLPDGGVILLDGKLYGAFGNILYEYDLTTSSYEVRHVFQSDLPTGTLTSGPDGKIYGTTANATIFQFDPATYALSSWSLGDGNNYTSGGLTLAGNGRFYGMTWTGSPHALGMIYEFDPETSTATEKKTLDQHNGIFPNGEFLQATNGKLYGMTGQGGAENGGTLIEYDPATNIMAKKVDFTFETGKNPSGNLAMDNEGILYGLTFAGGASGRGTLFQYNPLTSVFVKKINLDYPIEGGYPNGSLVPGGNGKLYGTAWGGTPQFGILFEYDTATRTYVKKVEFDFEKGTTPIPGSLTRADNGKLYGLTEQGGAFNAGVLFEYDPITGIYSNKVDFDGGGSGQSPGALSWINGRFYGTTLGGGTFDFGVLFEFDPVTGIYTKRIDFDGGVNGGYPMGGVAAGNNGKLYGTTFSGGGATNYGVLYEYDPIANTHNSKFEFDNTITGAFTKSRLTLGNNGKFYGVANQGGTFDLGVLYEFDPATDTYTKKIDFDDATTGGRPYGLIKTDNGKLYGTTTRGGATGGGVLYEYAPATNAFVVKTDFPFPNGNGSDGNLLFIKPGQPLLPDVFVTAPSDGATAVARTITVTSKSVKNATVYTLQLSPQPDFSSGGLEKSGSRAQRFEGLAYGTKYYARVKTNLNPTFGKVTSFTTVTAESFAYVVSPKDNAVNQKTILNVSANVVADATVYTIELNTAPDFSGASIVKTGSRTQNFSGLNYSTTYYSRVKTELTDNWGARRSFATIDAASLAFVTAPKDGAVNQKTTLTVSSNPVPGATQYTIELNTAPDFSGEALVRTGGLRQSFSGLSYSTTYYSRVKTEFTDDWGATRSFATIDAASLSFITAPKNGAVNQKTTLNVSANVVTGATQYTIELNTAPDFSGSSIVQTGSRTQNFSGLSYSTTYYSRVKTEFTDDWGATRSFTTPGAASLAFVTAPKNGAVNQKTTLNVASNVVTGAIQYTIELNTAPDFSGLSIVRTGSRTQNFSGLGYSTTYYSRVKTEFTDDWGATRSFTTISSPNLSFAASPEIEEHSASARKKVTENKTDGESVELEADIKLYPNPFEETTQVFVPGKEREPIVLILFDMTGHEIIRMQKNTNEWIEFGNEVRSGVYMLHVSKSNGITRLRIMKK